MLLIEPCFVFTTIVYHVPCKESKADLLVINNLNSLTLKGEAKKLQLAIISDEEEKLRRPQPEVFKNAHMGCLSDLSINFYLNSTRYAM